jgi:hypothetical protein
MRLETKVACSCPKGGIYSDSTICPKCNGTEWIDKNKAAVALGRRGGKAKNAKLTAAHARPSWRRCALTRSHYQPNNKLYDFNRFATMTLYFGTRKSFASFLSAGRFGLVPTK